MHTHEFNLSMCSRWHHCYGNQFSHKFGNQTYSLSLVVLKYHSQFVFSSRIIAPIRVTQTQTKLVIFIILGLYWDCACWTQHLTNRKKLIHVYQSTQWEQLQRVSLQKEYEGGCLLHFICTIYWHSICQDRSRRFKTPWVDTEIWWKVPGADLGANASWSPDFSNTVKECRR